jgi:cytochrome oxidase Cu insertion factor (SCO1/SenC/PrrC family)
MKLVSVFSFLIFITCNIYSNSSVTIFGQDTSYKGSDIIFYKYSDGISESEVEVARSKVLDNGSFSLKLNIEETTFVFSYLGIYRVHLYAEPGNSYEIILPPRQEKELQDFLNPYYSPTIIHLATRQYDEKELNTMIRMFNDAFLPYYNKHIMDVHNKSDFSELDKNIEKMDKPFSSSKNEFFNEYRRYRYGLLRYLAYQQKSKSISDEYFKNQPVLFQNPAFTELFNKVYDKYFQHFSRTESGKQINNDIAIHNLDSLRRTLSSDNVLGTGELCDLVILKEVHDEFYNDLFSRSSLLSILDTLISTTSDRELKIAAESIRKKVTKLLLGFKPPEFNLYDKDSNLVNLESLKGKYIYLNFCSCFSYTCLNEFTYLKTLYDKYKDRLQVVTILVDNDENVIKSFLARSNYQWIFLHYGNQSTIIKDYDIRAFPTYYLIDPDGNLILSPSPSPTEDFEAHFFKVLRARGEI